MDDEGIRDIADVIKTEKPIFGEGEDPSMLDCGTPQAEGSSFKKSNIGSGKRSDRFAFLENPQHHAELSKRQ